MVAPRLDRLLWRPNSGSPGLELRSNVVNSDLITSFERLILTMALGHIGLCAKEAFMCRNIRPLFNFEPPASEEEIRASALQFVRKVSGFTKPSQANTKAFDSAVDEVTEAARRLIFSCIAPLRRVTGRRRPARRGSDRGCATDRRSLTFVFPR